MRPSLCRLDASTKNLILTVLRTTATKREARQYIQRYADGGPKRIALVRLSPRSADLPSTFGETLLQMTQLGVTPIVLLDAERQIREYLQRDISFMSLLTSLGKAAELAASTIDDAGGWPQIFSTPFKMSLGKGLILINGCSEVHSSKIPILLPVAYDDESADLKFCDANDALAAIVKSTGAKEDVEIDKIIFVDKAGGPPAKHRPASHVAVNVQQELGTITSDIIHSNSLTPHLKSIHLANLNTMSRLLTILPSSVVGVITPPHDASSVTERNPIIYNILTDRPLISSSLPVQLERTQMHTSVFRKGLPVKTLHSVSGFNLAKYAKTGKINMSKLIYLIEQSFKKRLNLEHYLERIGDNFAAIIIAGDYEGAAILTYETSTSGRRIVYLDKFAVLPSCQGAMGAADILMNEFSRRLFPHGVLWRSRAGNPVNKWYFERSRGFMRVPNSKWVMFWTGSNSDPPLLEFLEICARIQPSLYLSS